MHVFVFRVLQFLKLICAIWGFVCLVLTEKNWMGGKKMRNLSYKKVDEHKSGVLFCILIFFLGGGGRVVKNVLYTLLLWILITLSLFLGCEKTKESWTEYSICPGDWQNPALNPRVSCCYWQTANSLHCRQSWCSTGPSGSTGKLYTGWIWCICVLTGFLNQPKTVWLSLSIILIIGICNMIGMKVQVNFR